MMTPMDWVLAAFLGLLILGLWARVLLQVLG